MSSKKIFTCILSLFLTVMICPVSNFFDVAFDLCETVDSDFEETSNEKESEDDKDELFSESFREQIVAVFKKNPNKASVYLQHAPPLLAIVSPPPEC